MTDKEFENNQGRLGIKIRKVIYLRYKFTVMKNELIMSIEIKTHIPQERPSNPLLRQASKNRFLRMFFGGTFL